ncbi:Ig domain-containing protein [Sulfurimonas xiamenensis]|uniref:Dystroglycan-type cadherin-like domain-containing protein n=1 Tax=Sulfurimonas xiamenensis TaxID=2590021 RepID=A0AAJ4A2Q5_9BACT|nr:Ig domain-containing protein [Sulfurimonas xiamenensis]QFR42695.1 hypothetical protein FJR47_01695 [Sulfurimonas xiamenensis]
MNLFHSFLVLMVILLSPAYLKGADACSSDYSYSMSASSPIQTHSASMSKNDTIYYYIQTNAAGTLTIATDNSNNKIHLNGSGDSCPSGEASKKTLLIYESNGAFDVNVAVFASNDESHTLTVTFIPLPTPPIMGDVPDQLIIVGTPFSLNISTYVTLTDSDPIISYALSGTLPAGLSFNTTTGILSGTPTESGTFTLSVTAQDKDGTSNSDSFTLSSEPVSSGPPVMGDIPDQDISNGIPYTLNIADYAQATDSAIESYTLTGTLPTGLDFNETSGVISGTPTVDGTYSLGAYATDGENEDSNTDEFTITVSPLGEESDLLIIKTPSTYYADLNQTVTYMITIANETSTPMSDVSITDTLQAFHYDFINGTAGDEVSGLNFNLNIIDSGSLNCGSVDPTATNFTCTGDIPKRTGNSGVPGLARIIYEITTPLSPEPALLKNEAIIDGTITKSDASIIVSSEDGSGGEIIFTPPPDHADVIDTDMWTNIDTYNAGTSKVLKTKISAQTSVQLTAVHLDGSQNASVFTPLDNELSFLVIPYLSNGICSTQEPLYDADTGRPVVFEITNNNVIDTRNVNIPAHALKNARLSVSYLDLDQLYIDSGIKCVYSSSTTGNLAGLGQCVNSANKYYDAFGLSAYERCQTMNGRPCESSNNGASDPNEPGYNPLYDNELGCLMCTLNAFPDCSSDNFAIRPDRFEITSTNPHMQNLLRSGSDYNTTVNAFDYDSVGHIDVNSQGYNQTKANLDINESIVFAKDGSAAILNGIVNFGLNDFNMSNGISTNGANSEVVAINFNDVGKVNLTLKDKEWASVDINNVNDPTPHDCSSEGAYVCGDINVTFIPHHFGFSDGNVSNYITTDNFTYISNLDDANQSTFDMAAKVKIKIIAQNESNGTTINFRDGAAYYENPISVNFTATEPNQGDANTTKIVNLLLGFGTDGDDNGTKTITFEEDNLSKVLRFNFPRQVNVAINPFDINVSDINISTESYYTQTPVTGYDSDANITGSKDGLEDGNATFIYGRTHASRQRYEGPTGTANIYFEAYCFETDSVGRPCNKNLLPNGVTSINVDDLRWFINADHNTTNHGNIGIVQQKDATPIDSSDDIVDVTAQDNTTNPSKADLEYDESKGYPYKTTMHNNASRWLIYNEDDPTATRNEFQVEFDKLGDWTGEHETDTTTKSTGGVKTNRRIMW